MLEIVLASPLLTVQDTGRRGLRHLGVPRCGMMDSYALRQANLLLGNDETAAGLEVTSGPIQIRALTCQQFVLMGNDMHASILAEDGKSAEQARLPPGFIHELPEGKHLRLNERGIGGGRCCLAFAGGVDVPLVLGSRSTDLNNGFGGLEGRTLRRGDRLSIGPRPARIAHRAGVRQTMPDLALRVLPGPDQREFDQRSQSAFWETWWQVSPLSNRMGLRLQGEALNINQAGSRLSFGVLPGLIQVSADGQPVILGVDAQTTGGYPCIGSVIEADLWRLAYLSPGTQIHFSEVTLAEAQGLQARRKAKLEQLSRHIAQHAAESDRNANSD